MEQLLERYLLNYTRWENLFVDYYRIDGAICTVYYRYDKSDPYKATLNINIWDMIEYLNPPLPRG